MKDRVYLLVAYYVCRLRCSFRLSSVGCVCYDVLRLTQPIRVTQPQPIDVNSFVSTKSGKTKGFTLVEILVVLSVIAMLLGILMPALQAARRIAYKTGCKENLHGCAIAFRMYLDDNKNIMPAAMFLPSMPSEIEKEQNLPRIADVLAKYLSGPEALKCPADPQAKRFLSEGSSYQYNISLNNQVIDKTWIAQRMGTMEVWILHDYEGWHGRKKSDGTYPTGAYMYLYADTLVADRERNK